MRFTVDVLRGIRQRCGEDFLLGVRYTGDEDLPGGFGASDGLQISHMLKDSGLVDFLNVVRSEEHTSELQSLMRISYAVFCLKKKKKTMHNVHNSVINNIPPTTHNLKLKTPMNNYK